MICPECGCKDTHVTGTRFRELLNLRWRRHECLNPDCMHAFTTYELPVSEDDLLKSKMMGPILNRGKDCGRWELKFIS